MIPELNKTPDHNWRQKYMGVYGRKQYTKTCISQPRMIVHSKLKVRKILLVEYYNYAQKVLSYYIPLIPSKIHGSIWEPKNTHFKP